VDHDVVADAASDNIGAMNLAESSNSELYTCEMDESAVKNDASVTFTNHTGLTSLVIDCKFIYRFTNRAGLTFLAIGCSCLSCCSQLIHCCSCFQVCYYLYIINLTLIDTWLVAVLSHANCV